MNTYTLPLSVGITDFTSAEQVFDCLEHMPEGHRRLLHVGVMTSRKFIEGEPTKWRKVWENRQPLSEIFIQDPRVFNVLHYADYDGGTHHLDGDFGGFLDKHAGYIDAIQLDMIWPEPTLIEMIDEIEAIKVILQVGRDAFEGIEHDPNRLISRLRGYETLDGVLLDCSGGEGRALDAEFMRPFVEAISTHIPTLRVTVAGGLGPNTLCLVESLLRQFPDISIDAQGRLRPSGNAMDPIDWNLAKEYLRKSWALFP